MKKFFEWWSSLGITVKYIITIILIIVPFVIGAVFTSSKNDDMDYYGVSFNIVQSERMRTFLVSDYVQRIYIRDEEGKPFEVFQATLILEQQLQIYDFHIKSLKNGNEELGLIKTTNPQIVEKINSVIPLINDYVTAANNVINDPADTTSRDFVIDNALIIDNKLYELMSLYEDIYLSDYNLLSSMNFMIVLITLSVVGFSFFLLKVLRKNEYYANYDILTGLRSRSLIFDDIVRLNAEDFTVFYIDIKNFKQINDIYGNEIGDAILVEFATRLKQLTETDYIYRFAGDEFIVLVDDNAISKRFIEDADELKKHLLEPFVDLKNREHYLNISLGIVSKNVGITDFEKKINLAIDLRYDSANYRLKTIICDTKETTQNRIDLKNSIATAIEDNQIEAYFQPLFTSDAKLKGFEALARWNFNNQIIMPGTFIPLINRNGMGFELDMKMIELVGNEFNKLQEASPDLSPYVSINLTIDTLNNVKVSELIEKLDTITTMHNNILLEILEDVVIGKKTRAKLTQLQQAGYNIALDDFTTGASSFEQLKLPEIDYVKIDKQVLKGLQEENNNNEILLNLIEMIHTSDKQVIIEGIETKGELEIMTALNVDIIQGYYYSKPLPINKAVEFIKNL